MPLRRIGLALCLLAVVACGAEVAPPPPAFSTDPVLAERTTWLGLYLRGAKIGWSRTGIRRLGEDRYRMEEETFMRIKAMGLVQESTFTFHVDFNARYEPLAYAFSLVTPAMETTADGEVKDGVLVTRVRTGATEKEDRIPLDGKTDLLGLAQLRRASAGFQVGDVIEGELFEPSVFGVVPYRMEVRETEIVKIGGVEETLYRVKTVMASVEAEMLVTRSGEMIRSTGPMGIEMKRESEEAAKDLSRAGSLTDLILAFSIDAGRVVENAAAVRRAELDLTGFEGDLEPGGVQTVGDPDSAGLRIAVVDLGAPVPFEGRIEPHLEATTYVQSKDERIRERAREIVRGAATPEAKADAIFRWVHDNLKREPAFTLPSAVDVLETRRGDCNEHAVLYCALARAAGLPCRIATGVAYMNGRFYYHAWNEVLLDRAWRPVDATFGENPAGALRLRLATGEIAEQYRIAGLAGKIGVRIRDAR